MGQWCLSTLRWYFIDRDPYTIANAPGRWPVPLVLCASAPDSSPSIHTQGLSSCCLCLPLPWCFSLRFHGLPLASLLVFEQLEVRDLSWFISEFPVPGTGPETTWVDGSIVWVNKCINGEPKCMVFNIIKNKKRLGSIYSLETKELSWLNAMWYPGWEPRTERGHSRKSWWNSNKVSALWVVHWCPINVLSWDKCYGRC